MRRTASLAAAVVLVAACRDATAPPTPPKKLEVGSVQSGVVLLPNGRLRAPDLPGFSEESRFDQPGMRSMRGHCMLFNEEKLPPGRREALRVVEFDPNTCDITIARGRLTRQLTWGGATQAEGHRYDPRRLGPALSTTSDLVKPPPETPCDVEWPDCSGQAEDVSGSWAESGGTGTASGVVLTRSAVQGLRTYDPVNILVNMDRHILTYAYDSGNGCVLGATGSHQMQWLVGTGWSRLFDEEYGEGLTCLYASGVTTSYYRNGTFCQALFYDYGPVPDTYVDYGLNRIRPEPSHQWVIFSISYEKYGGCDTFLGLTIERAT